MVSATRDEFVLCCSVTCFLFIALRFHRPSSPHTRLDMRCSFSHSTCTRRGVRGRTTNSPRYFVEANPRYIRLLASPISYSISVSYYHTHSIYLLQISMDEVESLRLGEAADATDSAGRSRKEDEEKNKKKEVDNRCHGRMAPAPTPPATATTAMATTAMTPSAVFCGEFHSLGGGAPLVSTSLDSLPPSVPLSPPFH